MLSRIRAMKPESKGALRQPLPAARCPLPGAVNHKVGIHKLNVDFAEFGLDPCHFNTRCKPCLFSSTFFHQPFLEVHHA
jgi:hypothetical protein